MGKEGERRKREKEEKGKEGRKERREGGREEGNNEGGREKRQLYLFFVSLLFSSVILKLGFKWAKKL